MSSSIMIPADAILQHASDLQYGTMSTKLQNFAGQKTFNDGFVINNTMPQLTGAQNVNQWLKSLRQLHVENVNTNHAVAFFSQNSGVTPVYAAYYGGVYSPAQNRIYLVPHAQSNQNNWHYIDCNTGSVIAYAQNSGVTPINAAYTGGVYSPTQNRVYFVPFNQSDQTQWHYIDCSIGSVVAYTQNSGVAPVGFYSGGVYSPTQNRIYLVPYTQSNQTNWHYIDCNTGSVVAYTQNSGVTPVSGAYVGGVYSPTQNRIYLVPNGQSNQTQWHYIDCNTGSVVAYTQNSGVIPVGNGYQGGVYSPTQNRIYLAPGGQAPQSNWHYIDCSTGSVVAYTQNSGVTPVNEAYFGSIYSPTQNRIYLVPRAQSSQPQWHYIDCNTGSVVAYTQNSGVTPVGFYFGGVYSPTQNRIYLVPSGQAIQPQWHCINFTSNATGINPHMFGSTILSSTY